MRVEDSQGRINCGEAQGRIGAAKSSHAAVSGRRGMDRQKHEDFASQVADNEVKFGDQVAKGPRGRDDRKVTLIKLMDMLCDVRRRRQAAGLVGTKLPHKSIINGVGTAGICSVNVNANIVSRRPDRIIIIFLQIIVYHSISQACPSEGVDHQMLVWAIQTINNQRIL